MAMASSTMFTLKEDNLRGKVVLFDLDGTLIDSTEAILESFSTAYSIFDKKVPDKEAIKALIGLPLEVMFVKLGVEEEEALEYVKAYKAHYRTIHTEKTVLLPRAKEAVEEAYIYARLGVVTTKTSQYSRELLEHFGLMQYFDVLIGREDVKHPKPHSEPIIKALKALNYRFGRIAYMVGDTPADMEAAYASNIGGIGVLCGYAKEEELVEYADFIKDDAYQAVKLIEKM